MAEIPHTILQFDIAGHSKWSDDMPGWSIHQLKSRLIEICTGIVNIYNGTTLNIAGDGGSFKFPSNDESVSDSEEALICALHLHNSQSVFKNIMSSLGFPKELKANFRISLHRCNLMGAENPSTTHGEELNWFLKNEREIGISNRIVVTDSVFNALSRVFRELLCPLCPPKKIVNRETVLYGNINTDESVIPGLISTHSDSLETIEKSYLDVAMSFRFLGATAQFMSNHGELSKLLEQSDPSMKFKFLILSPTGPGIINHANREERNIDDIKININQTVVQLEHWKSKGKTIEYRFYDELPTFRLVFVNDESVYVSHYSEKEGYKNPQIVWQNEPQSLYRGFDDYWNEIWNRSLGK